jgi:hypothetical protein
MLPVGCQIDAVSAVSAVTRRPCNNQTKPVRSWRPSLENDGCGSAGTGASREVPKEERLLDWIVVGVLIAQCVGIDPQALHREISGLAIVGGFDASLGPKDLTTEGALEVLNCGHRYGVDHLLVELGIVFRRRQSVGCKKVGIVQIHGLVGTSAGGINIDDLEIVTCWTWQQTGLSLQLCRPPPSSAHAPTECGSRGVLSVVAFSLTSGERAVSWVYFLVRSVCPVASHSVGDLVPFVPCRFWILSRRSSRRRP